jgi:hypothetical protein
LFSRTAYVAQVSRNGAWEAWNGIKNVFVSPAHVHGVGARRDGRLEIFNFEYAVDDDEAHFAVQKGLDPDSDWSDWAKLGNPPSRSFIQHGENDLNAGAVYAAAVGANQDGRLEVFHLVTTNDVWHVWETGNDPNAVFAWSGWALVAASPVRFLSLAVANNQDGRLELFAIGDDGGLWHAWQESPNGGWSSWDKFPSPGVKLVGRPAAVLNGNGTLEAFAVDVNGGLWNVAQTSTNNGWGGWLSLGGENLTFAAAGVNQDGRVEVFSSSGGTLWHRWETSVGGAWSG